MLRKLMPAALVAICAVAALAAAAAASGSARKAPTLVGTVGPGYTIRLTQGGKAVKTLKTGTYRLLIHDRATVHAFSLDGPHGFARDFTAVSFVGTKSITLRLRAGAYKYYCPPHESVMFGRFVVR